MKRMQSRPHASKVALHMDIVSCVVMVEDAIMSADYEGEIKLTHRDTASRCSTLDIR